MATCRPRTVVPLFAGGRYTAIRPCAVAMTDQAHVGWAGLGPGQCMVTLTVDIAEALGRGRAKWALGQTGPCRNIPAGPLGILPMASVLALDPGRRLAWADQWVGGLIGAAWNGMGCRVEGWR